MNWPDIPPAAPLLFAVLFAGGALEALLRPGPGGTDGPGVARLLGGWRALVFTLAAALAYPALFDLRVAPPLGALVGAAAPGAVAARLVPWLVAALAGLLPLGVRARALTESLQCLAATAALFMLFAADLGASSARAWPGWLAGLPVVVLAATVVMLVESGRKAPGPVTPWRSGLALAAQAPLLLLYGFALGRQVAVG